MITRQVYNMFQDLWNYFFCLLFISLKIKRVNHLTKWNWTNNDNDEPYFLNLTVFSLLISIFLPTLCVELSLINQLITYYLCFWWLIKTESVKKQLPCGCCPNLELSTWEGQNSCDIVRSKESYKAVHKVFTSINWR